MNILSYCAVNPERRFPEAEAQLLQIEGLSELVFDFGNDVSLPWYERILGKYRAARERVIRERFDALLIVESDMVIQRDAAILLQQGLADLDAQVAYGLYVWRHGGALWNAYAALDEEGGFSLSDNIIRDGAPNEWRGANENVPFQIWGVGFGCTLIRRETLEQIEFRNFEKEHSFYVDWRFAADCNARKVKQICHPRVKCGHITDEKTILYPDLRQENLYRSEILIGG